MNKALDGAKYALAWYTTEDRLQYDLVSDGVVKATLKYRHDSKDWFLLVTLNNYSTGKPFLTKREASVWVVNYFGYPAIPESELEERKN